MDRVPPPIPGTNEAQSVVTEARAVVAEADPLDDRPQSVAQGFVAEGSLTRHEIRLLLEIVRRVMWEEGEI